MIPTPKQGELEAMREKAKKRGLDTPQKVDVKTLLNQLNNAKQHITPKELKKSNVAPSKQPLPTIKIDLSSCKRWFFEKKVKKAALAGKKYEFDLSNSYAWNHLIKWIIFDDSSDYNLRKSILIFGMTGTGKTFLAETLKDLANEIASYYTEPIPQHTYIHQKMSFGFMNCQSLYNQIKASENIALRKKYYAGNWIIDDIGEEPTFYNDFGNKVAITADIIHVREKNLNAGILDRCIITTNLDPGEDDFLEKYGDRFWSRFQNLIPFSNMILIHGTDKRKL